jgi:hypothetical protein
MNFQEKKRCAVVMILIVLIVSFSLAKPLSSVPDLVDTFFSLFQIECADWVEVFSTNASFNHPKAGYLQVRAKREAS